MSWGTLGRAAFFAIRRSEQSRNGLGLFPNFARVLKAPQTWNQTFQFVAVGDDDEHFIDQIMGELAMGLVQSGPLLPSNKCVSINLQMLKL